MTLTRLFPSRPLRRIAASSIIWIVVGVPVAAAVAASRVFVWVILSLPDMVVTAAVLGGVHGLWLYLAEGSSDRRFPGRRFAAVSGAILGVLGFPPVFSRIDGVVADRPMITVFLLSAIVGGVAAGLASARGVAEPLPARRSIFRRSTIVGCLLVLPLAGVDYHFYWPETADRLPVRRVSRQAILNLNAGDSRDSSWTACYQYLGRLSRGSGVVGSEGGFLTMTHRDGSLRVLDGDNRPLLGGVNRDGTFRFGAERVAGQDVMLVLWEGNFNDDSLHFTKRVTGLRGDTVLNTTQLSGTAQRFPCSR